MLIQLRIPVFVLLLWAGTTHVSAQQIQNAVIELAVFYDLEFAASFDNHPKNIQDYWEAVLYDLHLRFQTLPSVRTSFRVTSVNVYLHDHPEEIYCVRFSHNKTDFSVVTEDRTVKFQNLSRKFQTWAYKQIGQIPSFDIAVLAIGSSHAATDFFMDNLQLGSICKADNVIEKKWTASAVVTLQSFQSPFPSPAEVLAVQIATILGAPGDHELVSFKTCANYLMEDELCCIMSTREFPLPKFFSNCTDIHISQKLAQLRRTNKLCVDKATFTGNPIIDSAKLFEDPSELRGYTIVEQCQIMLNERTANTDLITESKITDCLHAVCVSNSTSQTVLDFTPLESSFCGEKNAGRCFRGMCIQQEIQLVNVGTGKCLVSEMGIFGINDQPVLQQCSRVISQTLIPPGIIHYYGHEALALEIPYSQSDKFVAKRFWMNWVEYKMVLCSKEHSKTCGDTLLEIHRLDDVGGDEFYLEVDGTGLFLRAWGDEINVGLSSKDFVDENEKALRWKIVNMTDHNNQQTNHKESSYQRKGAIGLVVATRLLIDLVY